MAALAEWDAVEAALKETDAIEGILEGLEGPTIPKYDFDWD
jgi:hypothetical protein